MINQDERIAIAQRELKALGQYYRNDWSDFDGRTLRTELEELATFLSSDKQDFTEFTSDLKDQEAERQRSEARHFEQSELCLTSVMHRF